MGMHTQQQEPEREATAETNPDASERTCSSLQTLNDMSCDRASSKGNEIARPLLQASIAFAPLRFAQAIKREIKKKGCAQPMTIRKDTREDEIRTLKNEIETRTIFLASQTDEILDLENISKERKLTKKEVKRVEELTELARKNRDWINKHKKELADYRKPAIVMAS